MKVTVIPLVIGALGTVTKGLMKGLEELEIRGANENHPSYNIVKIGPNTKNPGDLRSLAVIQTPV